MDELLPTLPGLSGPYFLLLRLGILGLLQVEENRDPVGWWEWFWTLIGWQYKEVKEYIYLDLVYLFVWLLLILLLMGVLLGFLAILRAGSKWVITTFLIAVAKLAGHVSSLFERVFRLLASSLDPGSDYRVVIPNSTVIAYNTESIRTGSVLTKFEAPGCQVVLGILHGERFVAHGCGVRVDVPGRDDLYIITPMHVYSGLPDVFHIRGKVLTLPIDRKLFTRGGVTISRDVVELDTDLVALPVTPVEASQIGVQRASIHNAVEGRGSLARIVGPSGEGSTGQLYPDPIVFGQLVYNGSTVAGFSGAAYVVGRNVAGVHCAGGSRNVGYSLRLAYVTLLYWLKIKPEYTEEWLETIIKRTKKQIRVDLSWQHLDSVRFQVRGEFHIVDRETWNEYVGNLEVDSSGVLQYDDSESTVEVSSPESAVQKNEQPATDMASGSSNGSPQEEIFKLQSIIARQRATLRNCQEKLGKSGKKQKKGTAGPPEELTPESQS